MTSNQEPAFANPQFVYDLEQDQYVCPTGQILKRKQWKADKNAILYGAERETCQVCPHFAQCVTSQKGGRQIQRNANEFYIEWADHCLTAYERKRLMARRKYKAEGSFADAANNHGFKRSRYRGLEKVQMQNLLIAATQNLRKLMRHFLRKTAPAACRIALSIRFEVSFFISQTLGNTPADISAVIGTNMNFSKSDL